VSERGWKRAEHSVAELLGGHRVPVSGRAHLMLQVGSKSKGGLLPLTTAETYAKLELEEERNPGTLRVPAYFFEGCNEDLNREA
jgi:hypothetical protein